MINKKEISVSCYSIWITKFGVKRFKLLWNKTKAEVFSIR